MKDALAGYSSNEVLKGSFTEYLYHEVGDDNDDDLVKEFTIAVKYLDKSH